MVTVVRYDCFVQVDSASSPMKVDTADFGKNVKLQTMGQQEISFVVFYIMISAEMAPLKLICPLETLKPSFHPDLSPSHYPTQVRSTLSSPPLSPSITPSLFHSRLKTHLFVKSFPS